MNKTFVNNKFLQKNIPQQKIVNFFVKKNWFLINYLEKF